MHLLTGILAAGGSLGAPLATPLAAAYEYGGYVSIAKLIPVVILLLLWARLMTWIDKDAIAAHLPRDLINAGVFLAGLAGFALFFILPGFLVAFGVLLFLLAGGIGGYLIARHQRVGLGDLRGEFDKFIHSFGKKGKVREAKAGEVQVIQKGAPLPVPKADDPERPAYDTAQEILTTPLKRNAERIEVRAGDMTSSVQYLVDGVTYNAPELPKERAGAAISYLKKAALLDVEDRRKPQNGLFKVQLDGKKKEVEVATAGNTAGESMRITVEPKKRTALPLDALGLLPDQLQVVQEMMKDRRGIVLVSAPRTQGLTTLLYAIIRAHDAFLQHIQTIEHGPKEDLEGITQNKLSVQASPAEESKQVAWVSSQQPDIVMLDEMASPESAREFIRFCAEDPNLHLRRVYIGMKAGSTFEALAQWRKLVGDDRLAAEQLRMIISGRVMRRLCMACKTAFTPDPETLRRYNMNPQRVTQLFTARSQPLLDQKGRPIPCDFCHDLRYKGRFGFFEIFDIDDNVKQVIAAGGSTEQIKNVFRKQRARYLQEVALAHVEAGETSVEEVIRVLKGPEQQAARPAARPPARVQ